MSSSEVENLESLRTIAEELGIEPNTLSRWAEPSRKLNFPTPRRRLGRYALYDRNEVKEWVALWIKVSKNMNGGGHLNA